MSQLHEYPLSGVADFSNGFAFKSGDLESTGGEAFIPVVKMGHIVKGGGFKRDYKTQFIPFDKCPDMDRFGAKRGDILICMTDMKASLNLLGYSALFGEEVEYAINQRVGRIRPKSCVNGTYLYYYLNTKEYVDRLRSTAVGGVQTNLSTSSIRTLFVYLPDRKTQDLVADCLSSYDDLIENNQRRIALLEEAVRQLYLEWFVRLRFPGHEHTRITKGIPEGWKNKTLGDLCFEVRETVSPKSVEPDTPYIGLEHMPRRSISLTEWGRAEQVTSSKHRFREGEILFGKIRPYFHKVGIAFIDGVASSDAIVIRPIDLKVHGLILMTVSSDPFVAVTAQTMKEGSKMPRGDWKQMQQYVVPLPPDGLLSNFESAIQAIIAQLKTLTFANQKLRAARDLLLPRLMSGKIAI